VDDVGLVVFGGQSRSGFLNDLWAFQPDTLEWRALRAAGRGPAQRYGTCAALGTDGLLWISHGFTSDGRFDDTWAYDFTTGRWTDRTPAGERPVVRCLHDCAWSTGGRFVLYGGQTNGKPALGDLWALDVEAGSWSRQAAPAPPPRALPAVASLDGTAWIVGGRGSDGEELADAWRLDLLTLAFTEMLPLEGDRPTARSGAALVADKAGGRLLLFGGEGERSRLDDLWALAS
jgi:hypothetical protein